ncbi:hypothetical protein [Mesorhizobium sp. Cs1321R2N1]|uniref:hypothetical protein n=1 Tax=Mesorhizobium sp. Cs1321R2N1 TaxID=3015174 RepID=UPI00301C85BA
MTQIVMTIMNSNTRWIDRDGIERPVTLDDIIVITPYNAQVFERHPGVRVGTVDKFQGRKSPSRFIRWRRRAMPTPRVAWNSSTAPTASMSRSPVQNASRSLSHPGDIRSRMQDAAADAARQCLLPLPGNV